MQGADPPYKGFSNDMKDDAALFSLEKLRRCWSSSPEKGRQAGAGKDSAMPSGKTMAGLFADLEREILRHLADFGTGSAVLQAELAALKAEAGLDKKDEALSEEKSISDTELLMGLAQFEDLLEAFILQAGTGKARI